MAAALVVVLGLTLAAIADAPSDPPSPPPPPEPALRLGLTESNPHLISPTGAPALAPWRERVAALRPHYARVMVDWAEIQPRPDAAPDFGAARDGCAREAEPCTPWAGLREQLTAIRDRQRADGGGWEVVLLISGTPEWAAAPATGCERTGTEPRSRMPDLAAYRELVRHLQGLGREVGVALPHWAPWNEPNHPAFLNPQRRACDTAAPATAPARYARIVRVLMGELAPGQQLVLGDLAGYDAPQPTAASATEFIAALPRDVACAAGPWAQHTYVGKRARRGADPPAADPATAGNLDLVDAVDGALRARGCPKPIWISETGAFDHACGPMAAALADWARDPRIEAAFQYTFREDSAYPVGLADERLREPYASYRAWRAFSRAVAVPAEPCAA